MKLVTNAILILATVASVAALPAPASEAEIDALRAQGVSEHDIAARFPRAHNTATLLRRAIDADGEVAPGHYSAPFAIATRGDVEAHAGLDENSAEGAAVNKHVHAVKNFIDAVLNGRIATMGNGGVAMRRMRAKRSEGAGAAEGEEQRQQRPVRWTYHW